MKDLFGFELFKEDFIKEIKTRSRLFRHLRTGAQLLSLENDDENKVFGITFRTPPPDSTGLPYIMEHAVLCGSRKYPVKDPFVELMKGSLNTFVNAFTYPDKTCYPVASQNLRDFYNLVDVYLDAVFYPLIPPYTLQQEGWHYELESLDEPIKYKGVVFNEMKGAYSSPDGLLSRKIQQSLFPDQVYGFDSGGDPEVMPNLTYAQFKSFHETYYHPSNARLFFYGDDAPEARLKLVDEFLKDFASIPVDTSVAIQPAFAEPETAVYPFSVDTAEDVMGKKAMVTVNWVLPGDRGAQAALSIAILSHILVGTPASPLRKALIDSGLGEDLAGFGLDEDLKQPVFSTGLKGIALEDAIKVEELVLETLAGLAKDGIDPEMVAASLNTIEFGLRENNTGPYPRGLIIMLRALTTWLHDEDPVQPLAFESPLDTIKHKVAAGDRFFEDMLLAYFLNNPHRMTVILKPDAELAERTEQTERERLDQARAAMSKADLLAVIENTHELKQRQVTPDSPEALATIPSLRLDDLDTQNKRIPFETKADGKYIYHDLFTNGIVYLDLGFDLHALPQELLPYVTLFGRSLVEMGTDKEDFVKFSQRIGKSTGGIGSSVFTSMGVDAHKSVVRLFLRAKATKDKTAELLAILRDLLQSARLDNPERFIQILLEEKADQEARLVPAGHRVVNNRLRAQFNEADWAAEQISGPSYLFFLRKLVDKVQQDWPAVLSDLEKMRHLLIGRNNLVCNLTMDAQNLTAFESSLLEFLEALPATKVGAQVWQPQRPATYEGFTIPAQVNYVGKGANLYQLGYSLDGSILVIMNFLRSTWLWERVRVQGGAYGGFCVFDHRSGVLTYLSYRDPNLLATLENYDGTAKFLQEIDASRLSQEELTKNIIGAIGDMDAYQLPDAKGYTSMLRYLIGDTEEKRQRIRDQVLDTNPNDFLALGKILERVNQEGQVVVLGSGGAVEQANQEKPGLFEVIKLL